VTARAEHFASNEVTIPEAMDQTMMQHFRGRLWGRRRSTLACLAMASLSGILSGGCAASYEFLDEPGQYRGGRLGGEQDGQWTYYYENGSPRSIGSYAEDEQQGNWSYWFPDAVSQGAGAEEQAQFEITYEEGHLSGEYLRWFRSGSPRAQGYFEDDAEVGPWTFFAPGRQAVQMGDFVQGEMHLRWTYRYDNGQPLAEGYRFRDNKVGPWRFWDESGQEFREVYPLPPGWELVRELWPSGAVRREGFLLHGAPQGLWVSWHRGGSRRFAGSFDDGRAEGLWVAWDFSGALVAAGDVDRSVMSGDWTVVVNGLPEIWAANVFDGPRAPRGQWSSDRLAAKSAHEAVSTWLGEMLSPSQPAVRPTNYDRPPPAALAAAAGRPEVAVPAQPWRVRESKALSAMVRMYSSSQQGAAAGGGFDPYGDVNTGESKGRSALSRPMLGKRLPASSLSTVNGQVDLSSYAGRKVAVVIMRGFDGEVCVYCATQTRALEKAQAQFAAVGAEVLVVYPGDRDDLATFMSSVASLADDGGEPSFTVAFDPSFELVEGLEIQGSQALPTTLLLDQQGVIRWSYVGKDKVDRPDVERLLGELEKMPST
jgi:antitoxin component YwqK of YwqJK toxin-antitoxin module/peroxiredoxin